MNSAISRADLADSAPEHPSHVVSIGQRVTVVVLKNDGRIPLVGLRQAKNGVR